MADDGEGLQARLDAAQGLLAAVTAANGRPEEDLVRRKRRTPRPLDDDVVAPGDPVAVMNEVEQRYLASGVAARVDDARAHPGRRTGRPARRTPRAPDDVESPPGDPADREPGAVT